MAKKVDWGLKSSGPVVNGLQAALGLGAVTAVADYAAIHPIWALGAAAVGAGGTLLVRGMQSPNRVIADLARWAGAGGDRKSTRLNSSHVRISYAVFCLKKKTQLV